MRTTGRPWSCMKRVGPAGRRVRECAAEVVRAARGEQCLPGAKLVDTVSELTLVAIRTAATSYPRAAELSLQGTRGGARMGLGWQEDGGTGTLAGAVGWPRVHNRRSGATLCPGTDARSRGTQGTLDAAGRIGAAAVPQPPSNSFGEFGLTIFSLGGKLVSVINRMRHRCSRDFVPCKCRLLSPRVCSCGRRSLRADARSLRRRSVLATG